MSVLLCWRHILIKTMGEKACFRKTQFKSWKQEAVYPEIVVSHIIALSVMTYIQFTHRQLGAGVLKWFVNFQYVVEQKRPWLQYCDSATWKGGISYLIYANCVSVTMTWRCYQVWVRQCGDKGPTIIADERKDRQGCPWMNVWPIAKISYVCYK